MRSIFLKQFVAFIYCLIAVSAISFSTLTLAQGTYYTNSDNEDGVTPGTPDNDLGVELDDTAPEYPIEFSIDMTGVQPTTSAQLLINAFDIDEESGESVSVSINGNLLGDLKGVVGENTSTMFDVPFGGGEINNGRNVIDITISNPDSATVNWGQLIIDEGANNSAEALDISISSVSEIAGTITLGVDTVVLTPAGGAHFIELNLIAPDGDLVDTASGAFSGLVGENQTLSQTLSYQSSEASGNFTIEAHVFFQDAGFNVQNDYSTYTMSHLQNVGPDQLPADASNSTLSVDETGIVANGGTTATVTLQGVDVAGKNAVIGGQTVTFSATSGSFGGTTDNGDGTFTATYTSSTTAGLVTIGAFIDGEEVLNTTSITLLPGSPSFTTSTLSADIVTRPANGVDFATITIRLSDVFGNNLLSGGDVVTVTTDLGSVGTVTDNGDGTYSANVTSIEAGTATITGNLGGSDITDTVEIEFTPLAPSLSNIQLNSTPNSLIANGVSTSTILLQAFNNLDQPVTTGGALVTMSATLGSIGDVTDLNNGFYSATYTSPTTTGIAIISATFDGNPIIDTDMITLQAGDPLAANGTISTADPSLIANGATSTTITVQASDEFGNNIEVGGALVTITSTLGTIGTVNDLGDGRYTATLSPAVTTGTAIISARINGVVMNDTAVVQFVAGPADATTSSISASETELTANGRDTSLITVRVFDEFNNALEVGGDNVVLSASSGTLSTVNDLGNGSYQTLFTASTSTGTATITASLNGVSLSDSIVITLVPGDADGTTSQITTVRNQLVADGSTQTAITVQAFDEFSNPLTDGGDNVTLSTNLGAVSSVTDLGNGLYQATLTSGLTTGTATVSGTINGATISDTATIEMMILPSVNTLLSQTSTPILTGEFPEISGGSLSVTVDNITYTVGDGNLSTLNTDWLLTIPSSNALEDGEYEVIVSVTDIDNQVSTDTTNNELLVDTIEPTISLNEVSDANSLNILQFPVSGQCTDTVDTITLSFTDQFANSVSYSDISCLAGSGDEGVFSVIANLRDLEDGFVNVVVVIQDRVGNVDTDLQTISKDSCVPDNTVEVCDNDQDGISNGDEIRMGLNPDSYDTDGDGISDYEELDPDTRELIDTDNDGTPDALDLDSDNDGITDNEELGDIPETPRDTDSDGTADYRDKDSDNDRVPDVVEHSFNSTDTDNDTIPNYRDPDSDADGLPDAIENGISANNDADDDDVDDAFDLDLVGGEDTNLDGVADSITLLDSDGDGLFNMFDQDSDNDGMADGLESDLDPSQDSDGDGINDLYDTDTVGGIDADGDGLIDGNFPPDTDNDGFSDYLDLDSDNDGLLDVVESGGDDSDPTDGIHDTPDTLTTTPTDTDGDGIPNYLDLESDDATNDGNAPFDIEALDLDSVDAQINGQLSPGADLDRDGIVDVIDEDPFNFGSPIDLDGDGIRNSEDLDNDNDGIPDNIEGDFSVDTDGDGQPDKIDLDSDNDGITDLREAGSGLTDIDNDGIVDSIVDANNDGLDDAIAATYEIVDNDNDGTADFRDLDSDGDSVFDLQEANLPGADLSLIDANNDGIVDELGVSSGLTAHIFSALVDTDQDGIENYLDIDSDNDGFDDGAENGDFNNNGIIDLAEDDGANLNTALRGSGGTLDFLTLFFGICFALISHFVFKKPRISAIFVVIFLLPFLGSSNYAIADENTKCAQGFKVEEQEKLLFQPCWYASFGIGPTNLSPSGQSNGWSTNDKSSLGVSLLVGRHVAENMTLEFSYSDLGEAGLGNSNPALDASLDPTIRYRTPSLMFGYRLFPEYQSFNSYAKIGASWLQTSASDPRVGYEEQSEVLVAWGLGVHFRFSDSPWFVAMDYTNHAKDASFASFQIGRYFGFEKRIPKPDKSKPKIPYENLQLQLDTDQDGVKDQFDHCPLSQRGVEVDENGCCTEKSGCVRIQ